MLQDVESLTNSEMSIADNIIKVGYAVISADWRSADRTLATLCCTLISLRKHAYSLAHFLNM